MFFPPTLGLRLGLHSELPAGVTLQQIDGGQTYYASKGFTRAAAAGWDDPSFFPIGPWFAPLRFQSDADRWLDLGFNTAWVFTTDSPLSLFRTNGIWAVPSAVPSELGEIITLNGSLGSETVGLLVNDEPPDFTAATANIAGTANIHQDGRFWWENMFWTWIGGRDAEGVYQSFGAFGMPNSQLITTNITTPNATQRRIDLHGHDAYFISNANVGPDINFDSTLMYASIPAMTFDERRRACHYGDMFSQMEFIQSARVEPLIGIVENGGPFPEQTTFAGYITPPEMNAAIWSCIMGGARGIVIFNHTFGGPAFSFDNLADTFYQTVQSPNTISIYNQTKATCALIKLLAPVINSPFALNFVTVSPSPGTLTNFFGEQVRDFTGFDVKAKFSGGKFYVFAMPRYSQSLTGQTATFTLNGVGTATATVINEARTRPISGGVFTDTFATGNTVHIYRID